MFARLRRGPPARAPSRAEPFVGSHATSVTAAGRGNSWCRTTTSAPRIRVRSISSQLISAKVPGDIPWPRRLLSLHPCGHQPGAAEFPRSWTPQVRSVPADEDGPRADLRVIPPQGTPQTAENMPTVTQVEQMEYPDDWGAVELDSGKTKAAKDVWHDTTGAMEGLSEDERL